MCPPSTSLDDAAGHSEGPFANDQSNVGSKCMNESWTDDEIQSIVHEFGPKLLSYADRMLSDRALAHDAVQETYLRLCRQSPESIRGHLTAWLFSVCRSRVIDMQRGRRPFQELVEPIMTPASQPSPDPVDREETHDELMSSINRLSARQREVLLLRLQSGLSYREIAEVTQMKIGNVSYHMHAAVQSLRKQMSPVT